MIHVCASSTGSAISMNGGSGGGISGGRGANNNSILVVD